MRSNDRQSFRVEIRHIHSVANSAFEERRADRLCDLNANAFLRFDSGCTKVRRQNEIWRAAQWRIGRQRFDLENVERRACDTPILQRLSQSAFINQSATGTVDDAHAAFCFLQTCRIENVARLGRERRM